MVQAADENGVMGQIEQPSLLALGLAQSPHPAHQAGNPKRGRDESDQRRHIRVERHLESKKRRDEEIIKQPTAATEKTSEEIRLSNKDSTEITAR